MNIGTETEARGSLVAFINNEPYSLVVIPVPESSEARVIFRVTKVAGESYQVAVDKDGSASCECASYLWRKQGVSRRGCKHIACLRNAGLLQLEWRNQ